MVSCYSFVTFTGIMRVKIVLRDKESGRYYRDRTEWVCNPYDALTFRNILEAEEFCRAHELSDLQFIQQSGYFPRPLRYSSGKQPPSQATEPAASTRAA